MKSKVFMTCVETWRAVVAVEHDEGEDQESIKDKAWAQFDDNCSKNLEQENHTKIRPVYGS